MKYLVKFDLEFDLKFEISDGKHLVKFLGRTFLPGSTGNFGEFRGNFGNFVSNFATFFVRKLRSSEGRC